MGRQYDDSRGEMHGRELVPGLYHTTGSNGVMNYGLTARTTDILTESQPTSITTPQKKIFKVLDGVTVTSQNVVMSPVLGIRIRDPVSFRPPDPEKNFFSGSRIPDPQHWMSLK